MLTVILNDGYEYELRSEVEREEDTQRTEWYARKCNTKHWTHVNAKASPYRLSYDEVVELMNDRLDFDRNDCRG